MINDRSHATLELVLFKAGQHCFGVEASQVRGSQELPDHGISCIESLLSLSGDDTGNRRQCLTVKGDDQDYEISVAAPFELTAVPIEAIHPLPPAITARCKLPGLRGLAVTGAALTLLVDVRSLVDAASDCA